MTNVFDITAFGAVGDGKTDCTEAIQKALDHAQAVRGCVVVPPGVYLTGRLTMRPHTRFEGKSAWSFRSDGLSVLKLNAPDTDCLLDITGAFGASIVGLSLNGALLGSDIHGIKLYWEKYNGGSEEDSPTIEDCRIGKFTGNGVHFEHVWCFSIRHSMIHGNQGCGLYIDGWDAFILDNWFTGNRNGGILGGECVAAVTATGNRVEWNRRAGFCFPKGGDAVNLTGNFFDRSFGPAIQLGGTDGGFRDCCISGNVFRRNGCPDGMDFTSPCANSHIYLDGVSNITVTANTMRFGVNDNGKGTKSPDYSVVIRNSDCVIVQSNTMHCGYQKDAILWDEKGTCLCKDNLQ